MRNYGDYERPEKFNLEIKKDFDVKLDFDTESDWDFDIDIDKEVDKDVDIDVDVKQDIHLKGFAAEVDFVVEDTTLKGEYQEPDHDDPDPQPSPASADQLPGIDDTGNLEWDVFAVADQEQGISMSSFNTYENGYALNPAYATSSATAQAIGYAGFTELIINYQAYDQGFVASGELFAAANGYDLA